MSISMECPAPLINISIRVHNRRLQNNSNYPANQSPTKEEEKRSTAINQHQQEIPQSNARSIKNTWTDHQRSGTTTTGKIRPRRSRARTRNNDPQSITAMQYLHATTQRHTSSSTKLNTRQRRIAKITNQTNRHTPQPAPIARRHTIYSQARGP